MFFGEIDEKFLAFDASRWIGTAIESRKVAILSRSKRRSAWSMRYFDASIKGRNTNGVARGLTAAF